MANPTVIKFGFVIKHPTWQLDSAPIRPNKLAEIRKVSIEQAKRNMDSSFVYAIKDNKFYNVNIDNIDAVVKKIVDGEDPTENDLTTEATEVRFNLASHIVPVEPDDMCDGIAAYKMCNVSFDNKVSGVVYYIKDLAAYATDDKEGYFLAYKWEDLDDKLINPKITLIGSTEAEKPITDGINVIRLGINKDEIVKRNIKITAEDSENSSAIVSHIYLTKYLKTEEVYPAKID